VLLTDSSEVGSRQPDLCTKGTASQAAEKRGLLKGTGYLAAASIARTYLIENKSGFSRRGVVFTCNRDFSRSLFDQTVDLDSPV
jgi:hypothetical protein